MISELETELIYRALCCNGAGGAGWDELSSGANASEDERPARQQVWTAVLRGVGERASQALPAAVGHVRRRPAQRRTDAWLRVLRLAASPTSRGTVQLYRGACWQTVIRWMSAAACRPTAVSEVSPCTTFIQCMSCLVALPLHILFFSSLAFCCLAYLRPHCWGSRDIGFIHWSLAMAIAVHYAVRLLVHSLISSNHLLLRIRILIAEIVCKIL